MRSFFEDKEIQGLRGFCAEEVSREALSGIRVMSSGIRRDILTMIMNAGSGHVGGSFSSVDIYLMLWLCADITPSKVQDEKRDRIVISHGHTSPGLYAVLGNFGFFDIRDALRGFRKKDSLFEGHPSNLVQGVEWGSGSLGQGLSVGCGFAMASKLQGLQNRVFVVMGDGEQQKGQISEACAFAAKHQLSNLTAIVDVNRLQATGKTADIMPQDIGKKYEAAGWEIISIDGHDFQAIYRALRYRSTSLHPVVILAHTIMGKGVSFIENNPAYHGRVLTAEQYREALKELDAAELQQPPMSGSKKTGAHPAEKGAHPVEKKIKTGNPIQYTADQFVECRTAAGNAIYDIVAANAGLPVAVLDCDLLDSVKTARVAEAFPEKFIQCGIQEHNAATVAGALSKSGVLPFFLDFGVFGIDETYGQHRMNDMNGTSVKLVVTHCGLDVGEDGKTHQCIDYIALTNTLPGYKLIVPADANQTDRAIRYIASTPGNFVVAVGRSKLPVLQNKRKEPFYSGNYSFSYGAAEWVREGGDAAIITTGSLVHSAVYAADRLSGNGIRTGVLNISCPGQIDLKAVKRACRSGVVITYEDHFVQSGLGTMIGSLIAENGWSCVFKKLGVTAYGKSCASEEQYPLQNLDTDHLVKQIKLNAGRRKTRLAYS